MKKIVFLFLLLPLSILSQEIKVKQGWMDLPQQVKVGDVITYQLIIDNPTNVDIQVLTLDLSYNRYKLSTVGGPVWDQSYSQDSKSFNNWVNYFYNSNLRGTDPSDLDQQYSEGLSGKYTSGDWNIYRVSLQSVNNIQGIIFTQQFRIEDIQGTNYSDYNELVKLNWAYVRDRNYTTLTNIVADPSMLNLVEVSGAPAGTVTFQLETPNLSHTQDYLITLYDELEPIDTDGDGIVDAKYPTSDAAPVLTTTFDTNGRVITNGLKQDVEYFVNVFVTGQYDATSNQVTYPSWVNDVVTVSDVYLTFLQANGGGIEGTENIFKYEIQESLANISNDMEKGGNQAKRIDLDDSYALLAHLTGILNNQATSGNVSSTAQFYPITSMENGTFNQSTLLEHWGKNDNNRVSVNESKVFKLSSTEPITLDLAHGLMGDADLSHSTTPELNQSTEIIRSQVFPGYGKNMMAISAIEPTSTDADIFTEKVGDEVIMTVDISKVDLSGLQFNLRYDNTILGFKDVTFDTGNSMTNFAKEVQDRLIIGSIDPSGKSAITPGKVITLRFSLKQSVSNTAGLISFYITDAVETSGRKVKLNIR